MRIRCCGGLRGPFSLRRKVLVAIRSISRRAIATGYENDTEKAAFRLAGDALGNDRPGQAAFRLAGDALGNDRPREAAFRLAGDALGNNRPRQAAFRLAVTPSAMSGT